MKTEGVGGDSVERVCWGCYKFGVGPTYSYEARDVWKGSKCVLASVGRDSLNRTKTGLRRTLARAGKVGDSNSFPPASVSIPFPREMSF